MFIKGKRLNYLNLNNWNLNYTKYIYFSDRLTL